MTMVAYLPRAQLPSLTSPSVLWLYLPGSVTSSTQLPISSLHASLPTSCSQFYETEDGETTVLPAEFLASPGKWCPSQS